MVIWPTEKAYGKKSKENSGDGKWEGERNSLNKICAVSFALLMVCHRLLLSKLINSQVTKALLGEGEYRIEEL